MRTLLFLALTSCNAEFLPVDQAAPPLDLYLETAFTDSQNYLQITDADPGERVFLVASTSGVGGSAPIGPLGGLSLELSPPLLGPVRFTADASGMVQRLIQLPSSLTRGTPIALQAAVRAGPGGSQSYTSNTVELVVGDCGEIRVGVLPGYPGGGHPLDSSLMFFPDLAARAYDFGCKRLTMVRVPDPFNRAVLDLLNLDVLWSSSAASAQVTLSGQINSWFDDGEGGLVATGAYRWSTFDNRWLAGWTGVDGTSLLDFTVPAPAAVSVIAPGHPVAAGLPASFDLPNPIFSFTQELTGTLGATLLPGAELVMVASDAKHGVVAHQGATSRGVWFTSLPELSNAGNDDAMQAAYNAIVWAADPAFLP